MASTAMHSRDDIAQFLGTGETRLIAAGYRDPARAGEVYILPDGEAVERRQWAREHLRCMFDDCAAPALRTVSRAHRRDGFSHGAGAGKHAPESVNHRQGKAVVAEWLRATYPTASVVVEQATDTQRSNIADVMLTLETGQRVAFEVQYAALTVAEWRRRHESYVEQGVIDVWLWGHTRVRKSRREYASGPFKLEEVQDALRRAGMRVTFLNPETGQIGIAAESASPESRLATEREYWLVVDELFAARASRSGLTSPRISHLIAATRKREKEAEEFQQRMRAARENGARQHQAYVEQSKRRRAKEHARMEGFRTRRLARESQQQVVRPQRKLLCEFILAPTLDWRMNAVRYRYCRFCCQPEAPGDDGTRVCRLTRPRGN